MKRYQKILFESLFALSLLVTSVMAGTLPNRSWATATITTIPTPRMANLTALIGGNTSKVDGPNFG